MTDKILVERSVMEQALDALCNTETVSGEQCDVEYHAIMALRAALEQPQVEQELVSKSDNYLNGYCAGRTDLLKEQQREQEPYLWHDPVRDQFWNREDAQYMDMSGTIPLYTHPQPPRQPLTDEQLDALRIEGRQHWLGKRQIARAIERAHGIVGE